MRMSYKAPGFPKRSNRASSLDRISRRNHHKSLNKSMKYHMGLDIFQNEKVSTEFSHRIVVNWWAENSSFCRFEAKTFWKQNGPNSLVNERNHKSITWSRLWIGKLLLKMTLEREKESVVCIRTNGLVWARMNYSPYWPARIVETPSFMGNTPLRKVCVMFFGTKKLWVIQWNLKTDWMWKMSSLFPPSTFFAPQWIRRSWKYSQLFKQSGATSK